MSVAAERSHSPTHFGHKRSFEPADSPEHSYSSEHHTKRPRRHHRASLSREGRSEAQHASAARASTLLALKGLFPCMEEQVCRPHLLHYATPLKWSVRANTKASGVHSCISTTHVMKAVHVASIVNEK